MVSARICQIPGRSWTKNSPQESVNAAFSADLFQNNLKWPKPEGGIKFMALFVQDDDTGL